MLIDARTEPLSGGETYEAPPPRDRLPTLPEDLSEYAWVHTGPPSWSSEPFAAPAEDVTESEQSALDDISAGLLVDLWHSDVPTVLGAVEAIIDEREAHLLSLMDGRATIGTLLETSGLALPDVLGALCELCARGVVGLDRSRRLVR